MSYFALPDQTIPENQKNEEFHIKHAIEYARFSNPGTADDRKKEIEKLYRAYFAELSPEQEGLVKSITCPNGVNLGVQFIVYPLIQTKIEQIVGEYMSRPLRKKAYVIDKKSISKKLDKKLDLLTEEVMRGVSQETKEELGFEIETQHKDVELPPDVEEFMTKKFKMIAEDVADNLAQLWLEVNKGKNRIPEMFTDFCIADQCHAIVDKMKGHTIARKVHPLDADHDTDPYQAIQDDHEYFFENYWLTKNEIFNIFKLDKKKKDAVNAIFSAFTTGDNTNNSEPLKNAKKYDGWVNTDNKTTRMRVVSGMWKSQKKVSIKVSESKKTQKVFYKKLGIDEKARENDNIKEIYGEVPRFVQMLGPEICLDFGIMKQRFSSIDNPYICKLPVVSLVRDIATGSSQIKSPAAKLYQLQQLASEILFEIRLAVKHMGDSRILIYDVAQTPKDVSKKGYDSALDRVMHHIKKDKIMFINSKDRAQQKNTFNQFNSLDLSAKGTMQDMFTALAMIEDMASKFVGISPEREGQVGQYQTAGGTNAAIAGSAARTEVVFTPFDEFVQTLIERVIMKSKHDYSEGEVLQMAFGDLEAKFIKIYKEFFESDLGIYLSDSRKDKEKAQRIDAAAEQALSSSNAIEMMEGLIDVLEAETASEKKAVFKRTMKSYMELQEANRKAAEEQAKLEAQTEQAKLEQTKQIADDRNASQERIADTYANNKAITEGMKATTTERVKAAELEQKDRSDTKKTPQKA